jgi:hypothetical protein
MKVVNDYYAIYHTEESEGFDICIKDSCDRFALISKDDVENLIEDLVRFMNYRFETESVFTKFGEL